ncbi:MAG: HINT domain-containing protein, partial [Proteobacteria bacterium]|nr:HINT domain-containing protein [Pseudomonadota bacterium]
LAFGGAALVKGLARFAARRAAKMCFGEGTLIETKKGYKPIEDIIPGDEVRSRDDRTGEETWARVVQIFVTHDAEVLEVVLLQANGDKQTLVVTPEHPLQGVDGWAPVGELNIGEQVSANDGWANIISMASLEERQTVYNFEVEGTHTYFVGTAGVWAHNTCAARGGGQAPKLLNAVPKSVRNTANHIFGPKSLAKHKLGPVLEAYGGDAVGATYGLQNAAQALANSGAIKGVFETTVRVTGQDVTVRGAVVDGVVRLGTAFIP